MEKISGAPEKTELLKDVVGYSLGLKEAERHLKNATDNTERCAELYANVESKALSSLSLEKGYYVEWNEETYRVEVRHNSDLEDTEIKIEKVSL